MFNVRKKDKIDIYQVLSVYCDEVSGATFFLIWENDGWRWRDSKNFVPPNYEGDRKIDN